MDDNLDFKRDFGIEYDALDIEWIRHPQTYMKWAEASAMADQLVREKEEALARVDALIDNEVRINNEGKDKRVTADFVKAQIAADQRHIAATMDLNDAIFNAKKCTSAVKALEHKKSALENLVRLWAGQYFSGPREPRDLKEKIEFERHAMDKLSDRFKRNN